MVHQFRKVSLIYQTRLRSFANQVEIQSTLMERDCQNYAVHDVFNWGIEVAKSKCAEDMIFPNP